MTGPQVAGCSRVAEPGAEEYTNIEPLFVRLGLLDDFAARRHLRERIIAVCLPLAEHIAQRFNGRGESFDDLLQVARLGLVKAVDRYEHTRGPDFLSYAVPTIMGEVRRYFRDHAWAVHVPRGVKEDHLRIRSAVDDLTARLSRAPTVSEIAAEIGDLDLDRVTEALLAGNAYHTDSVDTSGLDRDDGRQSAIDTHGEPDPGYDYIDEHLTAAPLIARLPERDRTVLRLRFFQNMTQTEIARRIGCSQMQVSRILSGVLDRLRAQAFSAA